MIRTRSGRSMLATAGGVLALGVAAGPAFGAGYTLNLSGPPSATVGQPVIIQATGSNPADDFFSSWLDVSAIPASVVSTCPAGYFNAMQLAETTGGEQISTALREDVDGAGNFSLPLGFTPSKAGRFLICGYTNDGATSTRATSSMLMDVEGGGGPAGAQGPAQGGPQAGSPGLAKPSNTGKPRLTRAGGKLVCRPGTWANTPSGYSYGWLVNGRRKTGATGSKLRVTRSLRGRKVKCRVTASNGAGTASAVSRALRVH
jgi:hypothetical protein